MTANQRTPMLHNEGLTTRNWTSYNFQVLRDDIYTLGIDGTVTGNRVAPVRSACAVVVSSQNNDRDWLYYQQQTVSAEGFSGQAFSTFVPHTVRGKETKGCTDCHVSRANDNNAWMAQLLLQGTNFMNFMGRYVFVAAGEKGYEAVAVTEHDEPPAVIGSDFQKMAYPDNYKEHVANHGALKESHHHPGADVLDLQARGEYLYAAMGKGGLRVYDIANIDNKDISERMVTAPVSQLGQRFYVPTKYAMAVATPTTLAVDPLRTHRKENEEQSVHLMYGFLYVADKYEGLILVNAATLLDGDPLNNYLKRALDPAKFTNGAFNPGGVLNDANNITIAGDYAYITTTNGLAVVSIEDPLNPRIVKQISAPELKHPRAIAIQFRYGFVVDDDGLKVLDVTLPESAKLIPNALVSLREAHDVYVARTYAYVANGKEGVAIIDVEHPEKPRLDQMYDADGKLNDVQQVKIAMTNASLFAYVADGHNGLRVLQLTSPETVPEYAGFSPRPRPVLIATFKTKGEALAVSKPLDRDRAVDESGNQVSVFGRRGARPFNFDEIMRMLRTNDGQGDWFMVSDTPRTQPKN